MISTGPLAKPPRKRNTIDVKALVNHNTTFQHPGTLESAADKPRLIGLRLSWTRPFLSLLPVAHPPHNDKVLASLQDTQPCRREMKRILNV